MKSNQRKLHPNLSQNSLDQSLIKSSSHSPKGQIQTDFDPTPLTWLKSDLNQLKTNSQELANHNEWIGESKIKMNRLSQKVLNLEERVEALSTEIKMSYSKISAKMSEKVSSDSKIEAFMEKHNQIIHNFERKMNQMSKLLEDYQNKIMISNAALDDARREITRMKRL